MISRKLVKQKSSIHGYGLFARESIKKGESVCFDTGDMESLTPEQFECLSKLEKEELNRYGFYDSRDGLIKRETDDGIYFNHSETPNVTDIGETMIANTDIKTGEELTVDYSPYYLPGEKLPDFITAKLDVCSKK
ncbi:MAG: SET domain-containing protein [Candidatus Nitrosotenuis sp.]